METLLSPSTSRRSSNGNSSSRPSWLLSTLSELEERMKILAMSSNTEDHQETEGDTFAERAESYYRKRPQLLNLLQDLYNSYVTLSDRYMHSNSKNTPVSKRHVVHAFTSTNDAESECESEVESSLSYHQPQEEQAQDSHTTSQICEEDYDALVAEVVGKSVEVELALEEASSWERRFNESTRKSDLQRSLLEVLESERVVLLNENARLEYQAASLAAEARFMRCRASELTRRGGVCQLSARIEDLQAQIRCLEQKQQMGLRSCCSSTSFGSSTGTSKSEGGESDGCFKVIRNIEFSPLIRKHLEISGSASPVVVVVDDDDDQKKKISSSSGLVAFWGRVKKMDLFVCGAKSIASSSS